MSATRCHNCHGRANVNDGGLCSDCASIGADGFPPRAEEGYPTVPADIPRGIIGWAVGRMHVSTPPLVVALDIGRRTRVDRVAWTRYRRRLAMAYALAEHGKNGHLYNAVMGGGR